MTEAPPGARRPHDVESLVDTAVRVFNERGYDGASILDIAKAAGLSKSSIYHHVASKEELLERGIRRALDALFATLDEPLASDGPAAARVRYVLRRTVEVMADQLAEVALLLRVRGNTATERWALERRREFDHRVSGLLREAIAEGELRGDLDPALVMRLVFGMSNSISEWYRPDRHLRARDIADAMEAVIFEGLERRER